jgi:hypothetical protein
VQALPAVEQALPAVAQPLPAVVQALPAVVQAVPADVQAKPASLAGVPSARGDAAMRFTACAALLAGALVALAGQASAQESTYVEKKTSDGQDVRFRDDPIGALTRDPIGSQLSGFHPPKRFDLMRPRKTWIPEMLKSIENM